MGRSSPWRNRRRLALIGAVETWLRDLAGGYARFADMLGDSLSPGRRAFYVRLFEQAPCRALQDDYRLAVLWQTTKPIWLQAAGIPPVIWWNNLERVYLAVDDLDCFELLAG